MFLSFFFFLYDVRNHEIAIKVGNVSAERDEVTFNAEKRCVL